METPKVPKFNPGYEFLEDKRILDLDILIQEIIKSEDRKEKKKLIVNLEKEWERVKNECLQESEADSTSIKNFLRFVNYYFVKMDKGGMNMRRTLIGEFIEVKGQELAPLWDKFLPSRDWTDNS